MLLFLFSAAVLLHFSNGQDQLQALMASMANMQPVVGEVNVECLSNSMMMSIQTNGVFNGKVYPKGLSKKPTCVTEFSAAQSPLAYNIPLDPECGTLMETGVSEEGTSQAVNTIVVQPHSKLVTMMARAYQVRCIYDHRGRLVGSSVNVSMIRSDEINEEAPAPFAALEIFKVISANATIEEGGAAEWVNIGELLELRIAMEDNLHQFYGLIISNCRVFDGMGMDYEQLVDKNGCATSPAIFPQFVYEDDRSSASAIFKAHKFPFTTSVGYECEVDFCLKASNECDILEQSQIDCSTGELMITSDAEPIQANSRTARLVDPTEVAIKGEPTLAAPIVSGASEDQQEETVLSVVGEPLFLPTPDASIDSANANRPQASTISDNKEPEILFANEPLTGTVDSVMSKIAELMKQEPLVVAAVQEITTTVAPGNATVDDGEVDEEDVKKETLITVRVPNDASAGTVQQVIEHVKSIEQHSNEPAAVTRARREADYMHKEEIPKRRVKLTNFVNVMGEEGQSNLINDEPNDIEAILANRKRNRVTFNPQEIVSSDRAHYNSQQLNNGQTTCLATSTFTALICIGGFILLAVIIGAILMVYLTKRSYASALERGYFNHNSLPSSAYGGKI